MTSKTCLITGVGPGTGAAMARRFTQGGYGVVMLARSAGRLSELEASLPGSLGLACDVSRPEELVAALDRAVAERGTPEVVIHNAVEGAFGNFLTIDPAVLERNFHTNCLSFLHLARHLAPAMIARGSGAFVVTGNTSALRGKAAFAGFAPTKAALRILAQCVAREVGPKGVHVAHLVIDAVIDVPWTRERFADRPDDFFCRPDDIAEEVWRLAHQPKSAWAFDAEIRPFGESW